MHKAVDEMGKAETFRGYGPEQGYDFLRQAIIDGDYKTRGIDLDLDEVFVGDGAKTDVACIQEIFGSDLKFAVADPVYPVYLDSTSCAVTRANGTPKRAFTTASSTFPAHRKMASKPYRRRKKSTSSTSATPQPDGHGHEQRRTGQLGLSR